MVRREVVRRLPVRGGLCACGVFALVVTLLGCTHDQQQTRLQSGDEPERDRYNLKTIGDVTTVANAIPMQIGGVGLVVGLEGNGGDCPPDDYRKLLESDLHKEGLKDVKKILADPDCAMVLISGQISPGARVGDPIDIEVRLPARSQAKSLRGGYLRACYLFSFASTHQLNPGTRAAEIMLRGQIFAKAEGPVLVGFNNGDGNSQEKTGRIWAGGVCRKENPFGLIMTPNQQYKARMTDRVTTRINDRFQGGAKGDPSNAVAVPKTGEAIDLRVPSQYRLNLTRYLLVSHLIPLETPNEQPGGGGPYRQRLGEDLLDPARCVTAALRLEALGQDAVPQLKAGMRSGNELVRFCSAEALAYLDQAVAAEELSKMVVDRPLFRAFALTALASLDEQASRRQLEELLESDHDDETRYGAFRALRALEETHPAVAGQLLNNSFWLHRIVPNTPSLVHLSSTQRAEIVLFGGDVVLKPPFALQAGEYCVRADENDDHCTVNYVRLRSNGESHGGVTTRQNCSLKLEDILRTLTILGAQYPEAIEVIQQAESIHCLNCRVARDALPQALSEEDLAAMGRVRPGDQVPDLGSTPTLFETGRRKPALVPVSEPSAAEEPRQRILGLE